jgi:hypothetical protein
VQDEPLVVPAHHPLGLGEDLLGGVAGSQVGLDVGRHPVVEAHHRQVELGDDQVLVVAWVPHRGDALAVAGQVVADGPVDRPRKVNPAVLVGLFGLLTLLAGSVIRATGSDRSSPGSMGPPAAPSSISASRIGLVSSANGGRVGNRRPNRPWS